MLHADKSTLTEFLIDERRRHPEASGDLNGLLTSIALACKAISRGVAYGRLGGVLGNAATTNVHGEAQKNLDLLANQTFLRVNEWGGYVAGMVSEELEAPHRLPDAAARGKYLLVVDPLDGSSNIDVNGAVGSIFAVLRAPTPGADPAVADFLQPGVRQVCAGYAIYGPATMLVLTLGRGVHAFTLDPQIGEFILSHPDLRIPEETQEFAVNTSNSRFWEYPVKRYVDDCLAGRSGPRGKDFNMRWIASLVAETHRILMRGGVFLYPRDNKDPAVAGRLRLLYECNPIAMIVEQAGGGASTGLRRMLEVEPTSVHQKIPFVFGSLAEVRRIEQHHREGDTRESPLPLFNFRGLFSAPA